MPAGRKTNSTQNRMPAGTHAQKECRRATEEHATQTEGRRATQYAQSAGGPKKSHKGHHSTQKEGPAGNRNEMKAGKYAAGGQSKRKFPTESIPDQAMTRPHGRARANILISSGTQVRMLALVGGGAQHQSLASTQVKLNRSATLGGAIKIDTTVTIHQKTRVFSQ